MIRAHSFNGHHPVEGRRVEWLTPRFVLDALGSFDLDPCAAPDPRPWSTAALHYTAPGEDGLVLPWKGRVWVNPPYGAEAWAWLDRLADHGHGMALVFARVDVAGFHRTVWARATAILFLRGRLTFCREDGIPATANSGAPSCLVAYGQADAGALLACTLPGQYVYLGNTP